MTVQVLSGQRIQGYDLARGIAVLLMVVLNFKGIFSCQESFPVWLSQGVEFMSRRAAVILVMVAGAGVTLLSGYRVRDHVLTVRLKSRVILAKRALFLLLAGYLLSMTWSGDILHFYGAYILIGICFLNWSGRCLIMAASFFWLGSFIQFFDSFDLVILWGEPGSVFHPMADLFFTGYFPVFPWVVFFLIGMWLGRQDTGDSIFRKKALAAGVLLLVLSETLSWVAQNRMAGHSSVFFLWLVHVTQIDLTVPTPFSVISGIGTGLVVIMLSLKPVQNPYSRWRRHLAAAGKTSLTLYVCQIILAINALLILGVSDRQNIIVVMVGAGLFFRFYTGVITVWLRKFSKGPLEILMRRFLSFREPPGLKFGSPASGSFSN